MKVKKNDTVMVIAGKDKKKTGKVIEAMPKQNKIRVDGINVQKRSKKARSSKETSAIVEQVGAIDVSNVLVVCPACGKATRVGYSTEGDKKIRVCKKCGASLDVEVKTKKATKKSDDKAVKADASKKKTTKKAADAATAEKPKKATAKKKTTDAE